MRNTFGKEEKLCSKVLISSLFTKGKRFFIHPLKINWTEVEHRRGADIQVLIVVSKRNFKNAVDRNRIKRLIREAYRLNKSIIYDWYVVTPKIGGIYNNNISKNVSTNSVVHENENRKQLLISISYVSKTIPDYKEIEKKIILILRRFKKEYEKNNR